MSVLSDLRATLRADLDVVGVPVFASWPTTINPPCLYVLPPLGNVYISAGPNLQEFTVLMDVVVLADHADVTESLEALESLIEQALINSMDWTLIGVEPPAPMNVTESGADYLGAVLHLSKPVHL